MGDTVTVEITMPQDSYLTLPERLRVQAAIGGDICFTPAAVNEIAWVLERHDALAAQNAKLHQFKRWSVRMYYVTGALCLLGGAAYGAAVMWVLG